MTAVVPDIHERGPDVHDVPIGLSASGHRDEFDSLGTVAVPADHYWGAQTQAQPRTLQHRQRPHARRGVSRVWLREAGRETHAAIDGDTTLKVAALANGVSEELFDRVVVTD